MVELVYTLAQGASANACRFESHRRHEGDLAEWLIAAVLKIHPPHSRDFSRELGGWVFCVLRGFLCSDDQKVLSAKMPPGNMFHTDGVTIFGKEAAA